MNPACPLVQQGRKCLSSSKTHKPGTAAMKRCTAAAQKRGSASAAPAQTQAPARQAQPTKTEAQIKAEYIASLSEASDVLKSTAERVANAPYYPYRIDTEELKRATEVFGHIIKRELYAPEPIAERLAQLNHRNRLEDVDNGDVKRVLSDAYRTIVNNLDPEPRRKVESGRLRSQTITDKEVLETAVRKRKSDVYDSSTLYGLIDDVERRFGKEGRITPEDVSTAIGVYELLLREGGFEGSQSGIAGDDEIQVRQTLSDLKKMERKPHILKGE